MKSRRIPKKKPIVVVGMSGGVDSSVAAALLAEQGYTVIGVMMKYWSEGTITGADNKCCSIEAQQEALAIAKKIGIPFHVLDLSAQFKKLIVQDFLAQKKLGATPNPCVNCNRMIKFGLFWEKAQELFKADYIATGHYAKITHGARGTIKLAMGVDASKDQSYFLCQVPKETFRHVLFPLGQLTKPEVRTMALERGMAVATKKDSHEICFFTEANPRKFLERHFDLAPGDVVLTTGEKIGQHAGAALYTRGQRKGLALGIESKVYVTDVNVKTNTVVVTKDANHPAVHSSAIHVTRLNLFTTTLPKRLSVRIRHLGQMLPATIHNVRRGECDLRFSDPVFAPQPGQFAALYRGSQLLGGGYIAQTAGKSL